LIFDARVTFYYQRLKGGS